MSERGEVEPVAALLQEQLDRLLDSKELVASERLRRFVRFTVDATLSGHADRIKEYVLGVEVFDRGDDYDPRIDPIVRVEAGRLRAKLDEYYDGAGREDPIRIRYPKGSYVPVFEHPRRPQDGASGPDSGPEWRAGVWTLDIWRRALARGPVGAPVVWAIGVLVVLAAGSFLWWRAVPRSSAAAPVESASPDERGALSRTPQTPLAVLPLEGHKLPPDASLADAVTEALITELAMVPGLEVRSRTTVMQYRGTRRSIGAIARELDVGLLVEGGVIVSGDAIHQKIRLVDAARDVKLWANSYRSTREEIVPLQREVARSIAKAISDRRARDTSAND